MSNQTECRGWEIEDNYQQHYLDDPDEDLTSHSEGSNGAFVGALVAFGVLIAVILFFREWAKPPVLVFPVPVVQVQQVVQQVEADKNMKPHQRFGPLTVDLGWSVDCLYADTGLRLIRPNYRNAVCNEVSAKKRGQL